MPTELVSCSSRTALDRPAGSAPREGACTTPRGSVAHRDEGVPRGPNRSPAKRGESAEDDVHYLQVYIAPLAAKAGARPGATAVHFSRHLARGIAADAIRGRPWDTRPICREEAGVYGQKPTGRWH
jgi:hypothetical protein